MYLGKQGQLAAAVLGLLLLGAGCGGGGNASLDSDQSGTVIVQQEAPAGNPGLASPLASAASEPDSLPAIVLPEQELDPALLEMLNALLVRELSAAGKDISAIQTQAPSGEGNGFIYHGWFGTKRFTETYEEPVQSTVLIYELLKGDYDGNGEVNASDLSPLARHWGEEVSYLDLELPGLEHPIASMVDDQLARLDGNFDGVIDQADITVIAQHWNERLDGYRMYLSVDGGPELLLTDRFNPDSSLTVRRQRDYPPQLSGKPELVVSFDFFHLPPGYGVYEYDFDHAVDGDIQLRIVPVNLQAASPEGEGRLLDLPANKPPVLSMTTSLSDTAVPSVLQVDLSDSEDEWLDYLDIDLEISDELGTVQSFESVFSSQRMFETVLLKPGKYSVSVVLQDYLGGLASTSTQIELSETRYVLDSDWSVFPTGLVNAGIMRKLDTTDMDSIDGFPAIALIEESADDRFAVSYVRSNDELGTQWPAAIEVEDVTEDFAGLGVPLPRVELFELDGRPVVTYFLGYFVGALSPNDCVAYLGNDSQGPAFIASLPGKLNYTTSPAVVGDELWMPSLDLYDSILYLQKLQLAAEPAFILAGEPQMLEYLPGMHAPAILGIAGKLAALTALDGKEQIRLQLADNLESPVFATPLMFGDNGEKGYRSFAADGSRLCFVSEFAPPEHPYGRSLMYEHIWNDGMDWQYASSTHEFAVLDIATLPNQSAKGRLDSDWYRLAIVDGRPVYFFQGILAPTISLPRTNWQRSSVRPRSSIWGRASAGTSSRWRRSTASWQSSGRPGTAANCSTSRRTEYLARSQYVHQNQFSLYFNRGPRAADKRLRRKRHAAAGQS
ncbi:MAG: hypothetical protein R3F46_12390 [bacterium]